MKGIVGSLFSLAILLSSAMAYAVDLGDVVVTGSYSEMKSNETGSTIDVISSEDLDRKGITTLDKAVSNIAGLDFVQYGANGSASILLRGFDAKYTVVLIDGIRVYDPSTGNRDFDINTLDLANVERIEVLKGVQSSVYGSDAVAGVINLISKEGTEKTEVVLNTEFGSHNSFKESASIRGKLANVKYSLSASKFDTDGISAAAKTDENNVSERDGFSGHTFNGRFDYHITDDISLIINARYSDELYDYDDGQFDDDAYKKIDLKKSVFGANLKHRINDSWKHNFRFSTMKHVRRYFDGSDYIDLSDSYKNDLYKGRSESFKWNHEFMISDIQTVAAGMQYDTEKFFTDTKWSSDRGENYNRGYYFENKLALLDNHLFNSIVLRADDHSKFGTHRTFKADISYLFDSGFRLKANWGTGFKAPSLYQLYSSYGDRGLKPESINGFEIGAEQSLNEDKLNLGITFFYNKIKDRIAFDLNTWKYANAFGKTTTEGIETFINYAFTDNLNTKLSYTYQDTNDSTTGQVLYRRARSKYNFNLSYAFTEKGNVSFDVARHIGRKGPNNTLIKNFTKADLSLSYDFTENLNAYARIDNIFDEKYEYYTGFSTEGITYKGGIKLKF